MSGFDDFTLVSTSSEHRLYDDFEKICSAKLGDLQTSLLAALRNEYPELCITVCSTPNINLLRFAAFGNANAELDTKTDSVQRLRYFSPGNERRGISDQLVDIRRFAKYHYRWGTEHFLVYVITVGYSTYNYVLKEPAEGENVLAQPRATDALIEAVGKWQKPDDRYVYVYDYYWTLNRPLWEQVQKANWDDVILNEDMKKELVGLMKKFFNSKDIYEDLGVPWKRGVIFHGPVGNGKTISIKALMHSLYTEFEKAIPTLYVKAAPRTLDISRVFNFARAMSPCMLILEDIDTIVTPSTRSYFFNEVDGLENNDGIFLVASTNYLDRLDPGLSSRPSRFDRKYLFPLPSAEERILYCNYWREKLKNKPSIVFPKKLCVAIAGITQEFSFAYLKEAFVATLLTMANHRTDEKIGGGDENDKDDLDDYELWREMKKTVKILREDMGTRNKRTAFGHILEAVNSAPPSCEPSAGETAHLPPHCPDGTMNIPSMHDILPEGRFQDQPVQRMQFISDSGEILDPSSSDMDIQKMMQNTVL